MNQIEKTSARLALDTINQRGIYNCYNPESIAKKILKHFNVKVKIGVGCLLLCDEFENRTYVNGSTIIDGTLHKIKDNYIFCNRSLNNKSWSTTIQENVCEICFNIEQQSHYNLNNYVQLTLF